jgi:hypothetical protein
VNQNNEPDLEHVIATHVLAEVSESKLEAILHASSKDEFDGLLSKGRSVVSHRKAVSWSVIKSAADLGMDTGELGRHLRLPNEILQKLDLRLLHVASIPEQLFDMLADALLVPVEYIRSYVALPPAVPVGIRFHAEHGEPMVVLETFEDALLDEDEVSDDDRHFWLGDKC